jgi:hypothetical protein
MTDGSLQVVLNKLTSGIQCRTRIAGRQRRLILCGDHALRKILILSANATIPSQKGKTPDLPATDIDRTPEILPSPL